MQNKNVRFWLKIIGVIIIWAIYQTVGLLTPTNTTTTSLNLSLAQINLLRFSISFIMLATWIIGIRGAENLQRFSEKIADKSQQIAFNRTSLGLQSLVYGSILGSLISNIRNYYVANPDFYRLATITVNYLYVFPTLYGLYLFYISSKTLAKSVNHSKLSSLQTTTGIFIPLAVTIVYTWFVYTNPLRQFSNMAGLTATYFLSDPAILLTIIIPLFFSWVYGFFSVIYTFQYRQYITGSVYQAATYELTLGKILIVFSTVFLMRLMCSSR